MSRLGVALITGNREYLDQRAITLAERMRKAGYRTACLSNNIYVSGRHAVGIRGSPYRMLERLRQEEGLEFDMSRFAVGMTAIFDGRFHKIEYSNGRIEVIDWGRSDICLDPDISPGPGLLDPVGDDVGPAATIVTQR